MVTSLREGLTVWLRVALESVRSTRLVGRPISADLIERVVSRSLAAYCLLFGLAAIPDAFAGQPLMNPVWAWVVGLALFGSVFAFGVAGLFRWHARVVAGIFSGVFVIVMATWPFAVSNQGRVAGAEPWPWSLANVAIAAAAYSFRRSPAVLYLIAVPAIYVGVRLLPAGGAVGVGHAVIDAGYALVLGVAVLLLMGMLRKAAIEVDKAQHVAIGRYGRAVREHQTELERVQVDSILHDSVLTTFLTAARAHTMAEKQFAVAMAKHALSEVAATRVLPGVDLLVSITKLRDRFQAACDELGITVRIVTAGATEHSLPSTVVETFFAATLQALTNSVQHAGPGLVTRTVSAKLEDEVITIDVTDDGVGFDTRTMTPGRLGVRVSIIERVQNVGGHATITSQPGKGTNVRLLWPESKAVSAS